MKNETIIAIAIGLIIAFGAQTYMIFQLNDKVNQLTQQTGVSDHLQATKPKLMNPNLSKPKFEDDIFSDQNWNPYEEMQRMQNEMEKIFGNSFSRFHFNSPLGYNKMPELDLQEKPDSYIITVNAPGADESSLNVKLNSQILEVSIKTERTEETKENNDQYKHRERFRGEFHRVLTLPGSVEADKMKTTYRNGVLTITVPKKASSTPA